MSLLAPVVYSGFESLPTDNSLPAGITTKLGFDCGERYCVYAVHGFGSLFGKAFNTPTEAADALSRRKENIDVIVDALRGTTTLTMLDKAHSEFALVNDFFGGGKIFYWENDTKWATSSSITDLVSFLTAAGEPVRKSAFNAALLGFVGYGGGAIESPYEDIKVVDQFHYLTASTSNGIRIRKLPSTAERLTPNQKASRSELLSLVAGQIRENTRAFSTYPAENYICQLTGGLDSRSVFASLLSSGYADQFSTYTYGLEESPDMLIAGQLTAMFDLPRISYSGMRSRIVPHDAALQVNWSLKQTGGLTSMGPASIGGYPKPDSVVLSGGWGEMYRGGYPVFPDPSASREDKIQWGVNWILRSGSPYGPRIAYGGLFSNEMVDRSRAYAETILDEVDSLDIPHSFISEWMYLRWSTRFNVAEITRTCSPFVHRADPLCVPDMMSLIFATPLEDRKNGFLQLDLIGELYEGLELFPFDKDYVTREYLNSRSLSQSLDFDDSKKLKHQHVFKDPTSFVKSTSNSTRLTEKHKAEALRVKMPVRFIVRAEENMKTLRAILADRHAELSQVFDLEALKNITEKAPRSRPEYRRLETLTSAMSWYFDDSF